MRSTWSLLSQPWWATSAVGVRPEERGEEELEEDQRSDGCYETGERSSFTDGHPYPGGCIKYKIADENVHLANSTFGLTTGWELLFETLWSECQGRRGIFL